MFVLKCIFIIILCYCIIQIIKTFNEEQKIQNLYSQYRENNYIEIEKSLKKDIEKMPDIQQENLDIIAIIDAKLNFIDEIISIGIAIVDAKTFEIKTAEYFLVPEELIIDGFNNGNITIAHTYQTYFGAHKDIENHIRKLLNQYNITNIYTFNGKFIYSKLTGLQKYHWYDIMKVAAYKQYNYKLPDNLMFNDQGRLLYKCNIKDLMEILTKTYFYYTNHALYDVLDETKMMKLLDLNINVYDCAKMN